MEGGRGRQGAAQFKQGRRRDGWRGQPLAAASQRIRTHGVPCAASLPRFRLLPPPT